MSRERLTGRFPVLAGRFPVLAIRDFRLLLIDRILAPASFGFSMVGVSFAVLKATGSPAALSYVLAAQIAPSLLFTLIGGIAADRFPPQQVIIAANLMMAAGEGTFGVLMLASGHPALWLMTCLEAVTGTGMALFYPASQALLPRLVPDLMLQDASALSRLLMNTGQMAGSAAAGVLVAVAGPGWALVLCGGGMIATVPILLAIRSGREPAGLADREPAGLADREPAKRADREPAGLADREPAGAARNELAGPASRAGAARNELAGPASRAGADPTRDIARPSMLADLRDGWSEFTSHTWLWVIVGQFCVVLMAWYGAFSVLGPVVAKQHLGGPAAWGAITAADSLGLIAGGVVSLRVTPRRPMLFVVLTGGAIAIAPLSLAMVLPLPAVCVASFSLGVFLEMTMVQWTVALARNIPQGMLARVSSYDALGSVAAMPAGALLAGPLAAAVGVSAAQYGAAAAIVIASALALLPRDIRRMGVRAAEPRSAGLARPVTADQVPAPARSWDEE